jgi:hypothetical protein
LLSFTVYLTLNPQLRVMNLDGSSSNLLMKFQTRYGIFDLAVYGNSFYWTCHLNGTSGICQTDLNVSLPNYRKIYSSQGYLGGIVLYNSSRVGGTITPWLKKPVLSNII